MESLTAVQQFIQRYTPSTVKQYIQTPKYLSYLQSKLTSYAGSSVPLSQHQSPLGRLPHELRCSVMDHLSKASDRWALASTCHKMMDLSDFPLTPMELDISAIPHLAPSRVALLASTLIVSHHTQLPPLVVRKMNIPATSSKETTTIILSEQLLQDMIKDNFTWHTSGEAIEGFKEKKLHCRRLTQYLSATNCETLIYKYDCETHPVVDLLSYMSRGPRLSEYNCAKVTVGIGCYLQLIGEPAHVIIQNSSPDFMRTGSRPFHVSELEDEVEDLIRGAADDGVKTLWAHPKVQELTQVFSKEQFTRFYWLQSIQFPGGMEYTRPVQEEPRSSSTRKWGFW